MQTRWCKTEAGRNEIQQRTRKLPAGLRSILLLVDGQRSDDELQAMMSGLHAPDDALGQLATDGLIERRSGAASMLAAVAATKSNDGAPPVIMTSAERYNLLYARITDDIRSHIGLKGYFLQLKVERCANADDLEALLPDVATAMTKARDHTFATRWRGRARVVGLTRAAQDQERPSAFNAACTPASASMRCLNAARFCRPDRSTPVRSAQRSVM